VALAQLALGSTHDLLSEDSVSNSFSRLTETRNVPIAEQRKRDRMMDEGKILARRNLPLPPVLYAVLLSRLKKLFVSLLAAFGEGSRQLWRAQFVRSSWDPSSAKPFHRRWPFTTYRPPSSRHHL
jgi:hypothetical protein